MGAGHRLRQVARRAAGAGPADHRSGLSAVAVAAAADPQDRRPGHRPPPGLQRKRRIVPPCFPPCLDRVLALPVVQAQAPAHAGLGRRLVGTSDRAAPLTPPDATVAGRRVAAWSGEVVILAGWRRLLWWARARRVLRSRLRPGRWPRPA